jgi:hypothetical protein
MAGVISQLASYTGKKFQEIVTEQTKTSTVDETNSHKLPANTEYSIAHAIRGRIRFRVPRIADDPEYVKRLQALIAADTRIASERVNTAAASVVITYEPSKVSDAQMRSHIAMLIQSASDAGIESTAVSTYQSSPDATSFYSPILACSLEVYQAVISSSCGLFKSKSGEPLKGAAMAARITKLRRLGILLKACNSQEEFEKPLVCIG